MKFFPPGMDRVDSQVSPVPINLSAWNYDYTSFTDKARIIGVAANIVAQTFEQQPTKGKNGKIERR